MPRENTADPIEYPINEQLLKEATELKEKWRVLRDRLDKIEENRSQVTPVVYERVRKDYAARLKESRDHLLEKKSEIDRELALLRGTQKKVATRLEEHQHLLEEMKFRYSLGEFHESEYKDRGDDASEKLRKFETVLSAINANVERYQAIFSDEPGLSELAPARSAEPRAATTPPTAAILAGDEEEEEPATDESGYILESEKAGYFSDADTTSPRVDVSVTAKTKPASRPAATTKATAKLVIIKGAHAGTAYSVVDTTSLGRADSNTVVLRDGKASRQHTRIERKGNDYFLTDLNSSNGTFVNGERVDEHALTDGDKIQIGDCVLQFQK